MYWKERWEYITSVFKAIRHSFQDQPQVKGAADIITDYSFDSQVLLSQFYLLLLNFAVDPNSNYSVAPDTVVSVLLIEIQNLFVTSHILCPYMKFFPCLPSLMRKKYYSIWRQIVQFEINLLLLKLFFLITHMKK